MADIPLIDFDQFQMHTDQIKAFLNKKGWYYKGGANYGYLYRNDAPSVVVQGVGNTFTAGGNSVTIPASALENSLLYVADSESTISSETVDGGANISVNDINVTILGKTTGDTISLQRGNNAVESYVIS